MSEVHVYAPYWWGPSRQFGLPPASKKIDGHKPGEGGRIVDVVGSTSAADAAATSHRRTLFCTLLADNVYFGVRLLNLLVIYSHTRTYVYMASPSFYNHWLSR